jgi:hypothetical protein
MNANGQRRDADTLRLGEETPITLYLGGRVDRSARLDDLGKRKIFGFGRVLKILTC